MATQFYSEENFQHSYEILSQMAKEAGLPDPEETCTLEEQMLLEKMLIGAEYIESITPSHPHWKKANERYDALCKQFRELRTGHSSAHN